MNYIILNGKKSTFVKGLLIQSLAPITKPAIRTQIEEIDGRDGDIVTKLGYSAYDKEVLVGLHSGFDIDEVIEYFNSEGEVVFSNEPDKFYNYQIIDQIDFERLIRFRQATVKFHVQPFKHSTIEKLILETSTSNTVTLKAFDTTQNGVRCRVFGTSVIISGTATANTEFYIPIEPLSLHAGDYKITASSSGTGDKSKCSLRVITKTAINADSLAGTYLPFDEGSLTGFLRSDKTFNYIWVAVNSGFTGETSFKTLVDDASIYATNQGNVIARPVITLTGDGAIDLKINNVKKLSIDLSTNHDIIIDAESMDAYYGGKLLNRFVSGDYDKLTLPIGKNKISWSGTVSRIEVDHYSRWL